MTIRQLAIGALLPIACLATAAGAQQIPAPNADAQRLPAWTRSVVKIFVRCNNDNRPWTGAGTVVTEGGLVLTAGHVGSACIGRSDTTVRVGFISDPYREPAETFAATFVRRIADDDANPNAAAVNGSSRRDLALLQINPTTPIAFPALPIDRTNPLPGEEVAVAGFSNAPFSNQVPVTVAGLTIFRSDLISVGATAAGAAYRLHYGGGTMMGASGGPVIDADGNLIGIHSARRDNGPADLLTHYAWATSVRSIPAGWLP